MFLLAENYDPSINPTGWFLSEKLDGVRAMWDGKQLISRNGNPFNPPKWFTKNFPPFKIDGELWLGRKRFNETVSIVRSFRDKGWQSIKFMLFDIAEPRAGLFEERQKILELLSKQMANPYVFMVPQTKCPNRNFFNKVLDVAILNGAEGLMLRKPGSAYEAKRSSTLLKVKRMIDAEATVVGYQAGTGKFTNMMGALLCIDERGRQFKIGTGFSDEERSNPPAIGSKITYRYQELTKDGAARFPSFIAIRDYE